MKWIKECDNLRGSEKAGISFQFYFPILGLFTLRLNRAHRARPLPKICQILQDVPKTFSSSAIFLNTKRIFCQLAEWLEKMGQFCNVLFINIWTEFHPLPAADKFLQRENSHLILMMIMVVVQMLMMVVVVLVMVMVVLMIVVVVKMLMMVMIMMMVVMMMMTVSKR